MLTKVSALLPPLAGDCFVYMGGLDGLKASRTTAETREVRDACTTMEYLGSLFHDLHGVTGDDEPVPGAGHGDT